MLGSFVTGLNLDWFSRAKAQPMKILTGVAQITCVVALLALGLHVVVASHHLALLATAGALIA